MSVGLPWDEKLEEMNGVDADHWYLTTNGDGWSCVSESGKHIHGFTYQSAVEKAYEIRFPEKKSL